MYRLTEHVVLYGDMHPEYLLVLSVEALRFLALLHQTFEKRRQSLLAVREIRQEAFDKGILPAFLPETQSIRMDDSWKGAPLAKGLVDRRVEITGPVDRKMIINALNTEATQFMADFEDSTSPTWTNIIEGQINLYDAVRRKITFTSDDGKYYELIPGKILPTLLVRPRGWHLDEAHVEIDSCPISGSLFDFGMYFFHNAKACIDAGFGAYFYLPKIESHNEARLWNDVFNWSADYIKISRESIRATVLIETITAAFEMDEIIYALRNYCAGLNCGRWDYVFSFIKKFSKNPQFILPNRDHLTMTVPFISTYVSLLITTCHRRNLHAMGGMAAQIPNKNNPKVNASVMNSVRMDKEREVLLGHDGTWVAHPDLIRVALDVFNAHMPDKNQIETARKDSRVIGPADLLSVPPPSPITLHGIRANILAALLYIDAWLRGRGCVPISNLMEDSATAEIARSQLWQWSHHRCFTTDSNTPITIASTVELIRTVYAEHFGTNIHNPVAARAKDHLIEMIECEYMVPFLTVQCYKDIVQKDEKLRPKL